MERYFLVRGSTPIKSFRDSLDGTIYRQLVRSLMYLVNTRPDIYIFIFYFLFLFFIKSNDNMDLLQ